MTWLVQGLKTAIKKDAAQKTASAHATTAAIEAKRDIHTANS